MAVIRPATLADAEAWAEIGAAGTPYHWWDARARAWALEIEDPGYEAVGREVEGESAGPTEERPGDRQVCSGVGGHAGHRRRHDGGQRMAWVLKRYAGSPGKGVRGFTAMIEDDEGSRAAASAWGFQPAFRMLVSVTDPALLAEPDPPPPETSVLALADLSPEQVWWAMVESDEPDPTGLASTPPYDVFATRLWNHPLARLDLGRAVLVGDRIASVTLMNVGLRNRAMSQGTSTIPNFRGQGLATMAQHHDLRAAAAAGVTEAFATNHPTARAIAAVNEQLGYRHVASPAFAWRWRSLPRLKRLLTGR